MESITNFGERRKRQNSLQGLTLAVSALSLMASAGGWLWWGGRLSARVDQIEMNQNNQNVINNTTAAIDTKQTSEIAVNTAQFTIIMQQLNRLDSKADLWKR